jgi:multiple sugar transport system substrate-binding protein
VNTNKQSGFSRREFLRRSSLLAAGGLLAACAPAAPGAAPAAGGEAAAPAAAAGAIQYWFSWGNFTPAWDVFMGTEELQAFLGENTLEVKGAVNDEALLTAVASGTPPDGASNFQYLDFMARGVLVPIDDWIAGSEIIEKELYLEGSWNDGFYQGTMYGVPACEGFLRYGLNYNVRMVEEAGLDPDNPPQTWEECFAWHEALTKFDDAGNLIQIGFDPYDAMGGQLAIQDGFYPAVSWGWEWFDPETGEFDLDNEMMAQAFDVMGEFYKFAGPDNMAGMRQVEGQGGWGPSYNAEIQAMIIEGYWHPGETVIQKPEVAEFNRATWAPVPASRAGTKVQGTGGHYVILFKDAKNTEGMFKVAEFINTDFACDTIFAQVGWLPGRLPYIEKVDPAAYPGLDFYFSSIDEATEWSSPARCPLSRFARQQWDQIKEAHYRGEMTGAEAAAEFQKRCEEEWATLGL